LGKRTFLKKFTKLEPRKNSGNSYLSVIKGREGGFMTKKEENWQEWMIENEEDFDRWEPPDFYEQELQSRMPCCGVPRPWNFNPQNPCPNCGAV